MTVINRYSGKFYIKKFPLDVALGSLLILERNQGDNKPLIQEMFGFPPYFTSGEYMIEMLVQCTYWSQGFTADDLADFLSGAVKDAFAGREEAREITRVIEELRSM